MKTKLCVSMLSFLFPTKSTVAERVLLYQRWPRYCVRWPLDPCPKKFLALLIPCRVGASQPESGEKATEIRMANLELHDIGARREHSRMMPQRVREGTDLPKVTQHVDEKPE